MYVEKLEKPKEMNCDAILEEIDIEFTIKPGSWGRKLAFSVTPKRAERVRFKGIIYKGPISISNAIPIASDKFLIIENDRELEFRNNSENIKEIRCFVSYSHDGTCCRGIKIAREGQSYSNAGARTENAGYSKGSEKSPMDLPLNIFLDNIKQNRSPGTPFLGAGYNEKYRIISSTYMSGLPVRSLIPASRDELGDYLNITRALFALWGGWGFYKERNDMSPEFSFEAVYFTYKVLQKRRGDQVQDQDLYRIFVSKLNEMEERKIIEIHRSKEQGDNYSSPTLITLQKIGLFHHKTKKGDMPDNLASVLREIPRIVKELPEFETDLKERGNCLPDQVKGGLSSALAMALIDLFQIFHELNEHPVEFGQGARWDLFESAMNIVLDIADPFYFNKCVKAGITVFHDLETSINNLQDGNDENELISGAWIERRFSGIIEPDLLTKRGIIAFIGALLYHEGYLLLAKRYLEDLCSENAPIVNSEVYILRAKIALEFGKMKDALMVLNQSLEYNMNQFKIHEIKGDVLVDLCDYKGAEAEYEHALSLNTENVDILFQLSNVKRQLGKIDDSRRLLLSLIQQDPSHEDAWMELLELADTEKHLDGLIDELKEKIKNEPENAVLHYILGHVWEIKRENLENAIQEYREVLNLDAFNPKAIEHLARILRTLANHDELEEFFKRLHEGLFQESWNSREKGNKIEIVIQIAKNLSSSKFIKESIELLEVITRMEPKATRAWGMLGLIQAKSDDVENLRQALIYISKSLKLDPWQKELVKAKAMIHFQLEEWDQTIKNAREALEMNPDDATARFYLGSASGMQGNHERAERELAIASRLEDSNSSIWKNLGIARKLLGDIEGALEAFSNAMKLDPTNVDILLQIATMHEKHGDTERSISFLQQAIAINDKDPQILRIIGDKYMNLKEYDTAIKIYRDALKLDEDNPDIWMEIGLAWGRKEDHSKAEQAFRNTLNLDGKHANALYNLGLALIKQNKNKEARSYFWKVLEINMNEKRAWKHLIDTITEKEEMSRIIDTLLVKINAYPENHLFYYLLGYSYEQGLKDDEKALEFYEQALESDFDHQEVIRRILKIYKRLGWEDKLNKLVRDHCGSVLEGFEENTDEVEGVITAANELMEIDFQAEAIKLLESALVIDPGKSKIWGILGLILTSISPEEEGEKERNLHRALECINKSLELQNEQELLWESKANILLQLNRLKEVIEAATTTLDLNPRNSSAWFYLGSAHGQNGDHEKASRAFEKASELEKDDPSIWRNLGLARKNCGKLQDALDAFERGIELDPRNTIQFLQIAIIHQEQGDHDEATKYLEKALVLARMENDPLLFRMIGEIFKTMKEYNRAIDAFEDALEIDESDPSAWIDLGLALGNNGRHEDAARAFSKALSRDETNINALFNLGVAFELQGKIDEATRYYWKIIDIDVNEKRAWMHLMNLCEDDDGNQTFLRELTNKIRDNPSNKVLHYIFARFSEIKLENYDQAIKEYKTLLDLELDIEILSFLLKQFHELERDEDLHNYYLEVKADFLKMIRSAPDNASIAVSIGSTLSIAGFNHEALELLELITEVVPLATRAWGMMGLILSDVDDDEMRKKSIECLKTSLDLDAEQEILWQTLAQVYLLLDMTQEAINSAEKTLALNSRNSSAWFYLGSAHGQDEDHEKASRAFEIASELEKDDPSIWRNLGLARKNCGDLEGAINAFKVALDLDPEN
ncbi:tetratricopeptide repeat protein, partial [Candidatus Bathyarchaeota archaeon]|nr:tetratricopeptide repeat protein [Candidatus Bathyarchaeota archaeon]